MFLLSFYFMTLGLFWSNWPAHSVNPRLVGYKSFPEFDYFLIFDFHSNIISIYFSITDNNPLVAASFALTTEMVSRLQFKWLHHQVIPLLYFCLMPIWNMDLRNMEIMHWQLIRMETENRDKNVLIWRIELRIGRYY